VPTTWYWNKSAHEVILIDTGGLGEGTFAREIESQVRTALEVADIVLFVLDAQVGITQEDREVLQQLRRSGLTKKGIPILALANKVDLAQHEQNIAIFYELGLEQVYGVSAEHGRGTLDLQEEILRLLDERERSQPHEDSELDFVGESLPKLAILGKPNVGKSTLLNALAGEERVVTSPIAGTTVDAIDIEITLGGERYLLIDTAGIRRKSKTEKGVEVLSVLQARKTLERADLAFLVIDGSLGPSDQDEKIGGLIEEAGCSVILIVNKWDTQKRNKDFKKDDAAERIRDDMGFLGYAPLVFASAKERTGLRGLGDLVREILDAKKVKVQTREFTDWVRRRPEIENLQGVKFYLCHQTGRHPPSFVCHVSDPRKIHFSIQRNLINGIRDKWGYMGSPVRLSFVKSRNA
jgi:GTP-binding protein